MTTRVVNIRKEPCDIYIGRPSMWGNPYRVGRDGSRAEVIRKYENYFKHNVTLRILVAQLKGKRLGCHCAPLSCHGDILRKYADEAPDPVHALVAEKEGEARA